MSDKTIRGTREWAVATVDCCSGCSHGCRYCYARYDAVVKKKSISEEDWEKPVIQKLDIKQSYPCYDGQVMFPANHDILPEILESCLLVVERLLAAGNRLLLVSKPHLSCIEALCDRFIEQRDKILFRFTITAQDNEILSFWEVNAPTFEERLAALRYAHESGFATSVSVEPMLESEAIDSLVFELAPWVTHSIWIGKMNRIRERVDMQVAGMEEEVARIMAGQTDSKIHVIYQRLKSHPLVRWKESIKEVVGLELAEQAGLDI